MDYKEQLKQLPQRPGVYMMIDLLGNIIYVGKAKNLQNRVSQYFRNQKDRAPKVVEMIRNIHTFNYLVTDTELDALIEECHLIRQLKPRYNKQMKNPSNYLFIKITSELFPKVAIVKEKTEDSAQYFGPFNSRHRVEATVDYLNDCYPIRKCASRGLVKRANGCLCQQLGSCLGVCTGQISPEEYNVHIQTIRLLLNGNNMSVVQDLPKRVESLIETLQFEKAAQYTEYYLGLKHVIGKQRLILSSSKNRTIVAIEYISVGHAKLFLIRGNQLIYREVLNILTEDIIGLRQHIKQIIQANLVKKQRDMGRLSQDHIDEAQIIYSYLRRKNDIVYISIPSTCLNGETSNMDAKLSKLVNHLLGKSSRNNIKE